MKSEGAKRRGILKNYRQNSSGKATSLLVALTRAGALPSWRRGVLHWKCLPQWFEVAKGEEIDECCLQRFAPGQEEKGRK